MFDSGIKAAQPQNSAGGDFVKKVCDAIYTDFKENEHNAILVGIVSELNIRRGVEMSERKDMAERILKETEERCNVLSCYIKDSIDQINKVIG